VQIADLILPVFAVILTGWIVGYTGYVSRTLSDALIHFAYNIAMPALLIVTIAQEPSHSLINWRFLVAFGGGSLLCFILVFGVMSIHASRNLASRTMYGMAASMTNTGFVALPVLQAIYGPRAVLPAAIAMVFVAVVMFPTAVILLELNQRDSHGSRTSPILTVKHVVLNPMVLSTLIGMLLSVLDLRMPGPVTAYLGILADALTPCALFAIGLGLSIAGLRANIGRASLLSAVKLVTMPLIVYGLSVSLGLDPLYTIAAVICAAVPTAKRRVLSSHDSLQYLATTFGITMISVNGWTNKSEPSAAIYRGALNMLITYHAAVRRGNSARRGRGGSLARHLQHPGRNVL